MKNMLIINARIITDELILPPRSIVIQDGKIIANDSSQSYDEEYNAQGYYLAPGYIDLHCHGSLGKRVDSGKADLDALCCSLPRYGVTGFLPTVTPCDNDAGLLKELSSVSRQGSEILGIFLEGHYLFLTGALRTVTHEYSAERLQSLIEAAAPHKLVFGISPEIPELEQLLPMMTKYGFPAFITHTKASAADTARAIKLGACHATHFYDVFHYPGDKEPGVRGCGAVEAILAEPHVSVDFILDGEHVEPVAVRMALACKGPGGVCLITDANTNAGMPPGAYKGVGGDEIVMTYQGGPARMSENARKPNALAGSGLTMDLAVRNAVHMLGLPLPQAVRMASLNPAAVLGLQHRKGHIKEGYDADLVLLDDDLRVCACFIAGQLAYEA